MNSTNLSLLEGLKHPSLRDSAWKTFLERYNRLIIHWCRKWGVDLTDEDDLIQETLFRVLRSIDGFERVGSGSFRGWLRQVAKNCWREMCRKRNRICHHGAQELKQVMRLGLDEPSEAGDHLLELFDAWATHEILELAHSYARKHVQDETWMTYQLMVIERHGLERVTSVQGITSGQVYNRVFRVKKLVREELERIDPKDSRPASPFHERN